MILYLYFMIDFRNLKRWALFDRGMRIFKKVNPEYRDLREYDLLYLYLIHEAYKENRFVNYNLLRKKLKHVFLKIKKDIVYRLFEAGYLWKSEVNRVVTFMITPKGYELLRRFEKQLRMTRIDR